MLQDTSDLCHHGTNKQIFYKIYHTVEEVNEEEITLLLQEAVKLDQQW